MPPDHLPESFRTPRLLLRKLRPDDAESIFAEYAQDPEVARFLVWLPHQHIGQTREFLALCDAGWDRGDNLVWGITILPSERVVGTVSARLHGYKVDVGYCLARRYWGQGIVTEALDAVVRWLRTQPGVERIWALCDAANPASARVMEKVGMQREGVLRRWAPHPNVGPEPRDCLVLSWVPGDPVPPAATQP